MSSIKDRLYAQRQKEYTLMYPGQEWSGQLPKPRKCQFCKQVFQPDSKYKHSLQHCSNLACIKAKILFTKGERKADHYLRRVSHSEKFKDDYWGKMNKR